MVFSRKQSVFNVLDDNKSFVMSHNSVKNLGVILDRNLSLGEHIRSTFKKCFFHIRNIGKICKYINEENCKVFIKSLIVSYLDYYNSLYYGLPNILLSRLQRVQNTAARLISRVKRSSHITPVLKKLHRLPVQHRLQFKILLQIYKTTYGFSPAYLTDLISKMSLLDLYVLVMPIFFMFLVHFKNIIIAGLVYVDLFSGIICRNT